MSWFETRPALLVLAALALGACQPLHAQGPGPAVARTGGTANTAAPSLAAIDILPIEGRVGQKIRNDLIFAFTGGGEPLPAAYRLDIAVQVLAAQTAVVDPFTDRPEVDTVGVDAGFTLVQVGTGLPVVSGNAMGRATYTRSRQRFASVRAQRDAEDRAAKIVVEQIRARLLGHFAGTGT